MSGEQQEWQRLGNAHCGGGFHSNVSLSLPLSVHSAVEVNKEEAKRNIYRICIIPWKFMQMSFIVAAMLYTTPPDKYICIYIQTGAQIFIHNGIFILKTFSANVVSAQRGLSRPISRNFASLKEHWIEFYVMHSTARMSLCVHGRRPSTMEIDFLSCQKCWKFITELLLGSVIVLLFALWSNGNGRGEVRCVARDTTDRRPSVCLPGLPGCRTSVINRVFVHSFSLLL